MSIILLTVTCAATSCQKQGAADTDVSTDQVVVRDVEVDEFKHLMSRPNTVILDVRTPDEIADGKIPGAIEIDYRSSAFKADIAKLDKGKTYLVYCRSGGRSSQSCELMEDLGFQSLINLNGGYSAWIDAQ